MVGEPINRVPEWSLSLSLSQLSLMIPENPPQSAQGRRPPADGRPAWFIIDARRRR